MIIDGARNFFTIGTKVKNSRNTGVESPMAYSSVITDRPKKNHIDAPPTEINATAASATAITPTASEFSLKKFCPQ